MIVRKVLCPTDFSEGAEASWNVALGLANQFEAEVILLHVVPEPPRLTEAWFCCAEPTEGQHRPLRMQEHDGVKATLPGSDGWSA